MNAIQQRPSIIENRKRSCTDWPCLLIFIVLLILYILFAIFVFREGSLRRFIYPTDTQGRICGVDSQINRQYLQFFDIIKCVKYVFIGARCPTLQICVEQCPSSFYHYKLLYAQELKLINDKNDQIQRIRAQLSVRFSSERSKSILFSFDSSAKNPLNLKSIILKYRSIVSLKNAKFVLRIHFHPCLYMVDVFPQLLFMH